MDLEQRLVELETKISFQDQVLEDLSGVLFRQEQQIADLHKWIEVLKSKIIDPEDGEIRDHEKPPHY